MFSAGYCACMTSISRPRQKAASSFALLSAREAEISKRRLSTPMASMRSLSWPGTL